MPTRFSQLPWLGQIFTAAFAVISLATIVQPAGAQTETNSTSSSGIAGKWQNAKERGSNAWENVKEGSVRAWDSAKEGGSNAWSSLKNGTAETWTNASAKFASKTNYVYAKKDAFVTQANAELKDLDQKIRQLSDKTASATASAKTEAQQKLQSVKSQRGALNQKFDQAKKASQEEWNKAQAGFQEAYDDTKSSVKSAWEWLKSKTE